MENIVYEANRPARAFPIRYRLEGSCWINIGHTKDREGYGVIKRNGKKLVLHRYVLTLFDREPLENEVAMHSCDNKQCINPDHLSWGTVQQNTQDAYKNGLISLERKLTHAQKVEIQERLLNTKDTFNKIAKDYGVSSGSISSINKKFNIRKDKRVLKEQVEQVELLLKNNTQKQVSELTGLKLHVIADISRGRTKGM